MRISENHLIQVAARSMMSAQERIGEAQRMVASGMRVLRPSADAAAWAEGKRAEARAAGSDSRGETIARAKERLDEVDRALAAIGATLAQVRALAVQGASDTYGAEGRALIALEVRQRAEAARAAANGAAADGEFVLAGSRGDVAPFDPAGAYLGDAAQRRVEVGEGSLQTATVPGSRLIAVAGVDVFAALENLAVALETNNRAGIQQAIGEIDQAVAQNARARTEVGTMSQALDAAEEARLEAELVIARIYSRAVAANPIEAASLLAQSSQALEAAQASARQIIELTRQ